MTRRSSSRDACEMVDPDQYKDNTAQEMEKDVQLVKSYEPWRCDTKTEKGQGLGFERRSR